MLYCNTHESQVEWEKHMRDTEKLRKQNPSRYAIMTKDGTRIFVSPHWETYPSENTPLLFDTYGAANEYRKTKLPEPFKVWICLYNSTKNTIV